MPIDGILYRDENKNTWLIRVISTGAPFDYKSRDSSLVKKVKFFKCNGGVIIDGTPYGFEGMLSFNRNEQPESNSISWSEAAIQRMNNVLKPQLQQLQEQFAQSKHLFLSSDDLKLAQKYLKKCEKRFNEVTIKVDNAKTLI